MLYYIGIFGSGLGLWIMMFSTLLRTVILITIIAVQAMDVEGWWNEEEKIDLDIMSQCFSC